MKQLWTQVDEYYTNLLTPPDEALTAALDANKRAGLPAIDVSPLHGKFLELLVRISGAKRILEIGTLGAYSTICMARGAGPAGHVTTLEYNPKHAQVAAANIARAGLSSHVTIRTGRAIDLLPEVQKGADSPFDFIFIDADKRSNPDYLSWALHLSRPGTIIVVDNVVREGRIIDASSSSEDVQGIRRFAEMLASSPRLTSTALQTVGIKGHDGFTVSLVQA